MASHALEEVCRGYAALCGGYGVWVAEGGKHRKQESVDFSWSVCCPPTVELQVVWLCVQRKCIVNHRLEK